MTKWIKFGVLTTLVSKVAKFPLNVSVMIGLYIYVSEMSIVGPPPDTGWRFFCLDLWVR